MDTGPQKESDTTGSREEGGGERKGHFKVILKNQLRHYSSIDKEELTLVCFR